MKRLLVSMLVLGFVASMTALAEEKKADAAKASTEVKAPEAAKDITVCGKISKDGEKLVLTTDKGVKVDLPASADAEKMVGKEVKVVGHGKEADGKIHLKSIKSVVPAEAKAPEAPKAPEAAPVAK